MRLEPLFSTTLVLHPHVIGDTPAGRRMNVEFEGDLDSGSRLSGHVKGVNYVTLRPDGVGHLNPQGTITTPAGDTVALHAIGLGLFAPDGTATARYIFTFLTAASQLSWLNSAVGFALGKGDLNKREVRLSAFTLEE